MPPTIGDSFPLEEREKLAKNNFKIGAVFKFYCNIADKEKIFVFVGTNLDKTKIALVHINTEINKNVFPTAALRNEHLELEETGRSYLKHKSFVNCSFFSIKEYQEIFNLLIEHPSIHLGNVSDSDFVLIRGKIKASKILIRGHKSIFGF